MSKQKALKFLAVCSILTLGFAVNAVADTIVDPQLIIVPFVSCGGATTCNGATPFSLGSSNLSGLLPTFGGSPVAFGIKNNSGSTITSLTLTLSGTLGATSESWNTGTSGFTPSTNPFTLATIDGFNSLTGSPCTGGGVILGAPLGGGTCNGGALPATFTWTLGTGHGIANGAEFVLQYQSPVVGDHFTSTAPTPEPTSLLLAGTGLLGMLKLKLLRGKKAREV